MHLLPLRTFKKEVAGIELIDRLYFDSEKTRHHFYQLHKVHTNILEEKLGATLLQAYISQKGCAIMGSDLEIRWVDWKLGFELVAIQVIPKGTLIDLYLGRVHSSSSQTNDHTFLHPISALKKQKYFIDAYLRGSFARFINHSHFPNACMVPLWDEGVIQLGVIALKDLKKEEPITCHYGKKFWVHRFTPIEVN